jgi:hypothetical protein
MSVSQTYESHLVAVGTPLIGEKLTGTGAFQDNVRYLPFCQGMAYGYVKNIIRESSIGYEDYTYNRQMNWSDVTVGIRQLDYHMPTGGASWSGWSGIMGDLNIQPRGTFPSSGSGTYYPFFKNLITGGRNADGAAIYFITDTGERYRDQINSDITGHTRQITAIDPCYLSSVSWSVNTNSVAQYEFNFAGGYISVGDDVQGGTGFGWPMRGPATSGQSVKTCNVDFDAARYSGTYINVDTVDGLFTGPNTTVSGAPNFGQINSASWEVGIERSNVYSLGSPMAYDRKIAPRFLGNLTLGYNYEGREINSSSLIDTEYDINISCSNNIGVTKIYRIEGAILENVQLNSTVEGVPDTYSASFSFGVNSNGGLLESFFLNP